MNAKTLILIALIAVVLFGGYYYFSQLEVEDKTDTTIQIATRISPSPTGNSQTDSNGAAIGKICSPSEAGYIEARRLTDGKFFIQNTSNSTYSFELGPEKYHLRYVVGGIGDYATYSYNLDNNNEIVEASIEKDKTLTYNLCQSSTSDLKNF